jgi:hypothetical protein
MARIGVNLPFSHAWPLRLQKEAQKRHQKGRQEDVAVYGTLNTALLVMPAKKKGLYANIAAKRRRIKAGSGEKMRSPGDPGAPTAKNFKQAAKTAKKRKK